MQLLRANQAEVHRLAKRDYQLADSDLDTGAPTQRGEYDLADETYDTLLKALAKNNFQNVSPELKIEAARVL